MKFVATIRQALWGLQHIEREIIGQARARGVPITGANFSWNRGASLVHGLPQDLIAMDVRVDGRHISTQWPRAHLADSWDRIDRSEVRQEIERIVEQLARRL